jgi:hypothetical protein
LKLIGAEKQRQNKGEKEGEKRGRALKKQSILTYWYTRFAF